MASVLLAGIDPALVDFTEPGLPPGVDEAFIRRGLEQAKRELAEDGHTVEQFYLPLDPDALAGFTDTLAEGRHDLVVIGGGVRHPPRNLALFEAVLNQIARAARSPAIVLVDHPDQARQAVARVIARGKLYDKA